MSSEPEQAGPSRRSSHAAAINAWLEGVRLTRLCALIFLMAFSLRVALVLVRQEYREQYRIVEIVNVAKALYRTGILADPFRLPTGPTAFVGPLYPFTLSLIYHALGDTLAAEITKRVLSAATCSLLLALLPALAIELGMPLLVGLLAGLLSALSPLSLYTETSGNSDTPWVALGLVLLTLATARRIRRRRYDAVTSLWHGLGWGAAMYLNPVFIPVLLGFLLLGLKGTGSTERARCLRSAALTVGVAVLTVTPWVIRNYLHFHALIPIRNNFKLEFFLSNNPGASPTYQDNLDSKSAAALHPSINQDEARRIQQVGEMAYYQSRFDESLSWIRAHPERFARLTLWRLVSYWFPVSRSPGKTALFWALTVLAAMGLIRLARALPQAAWMLGSLLLLYPAVYYVVQVSHRYRYPTDWVLLLLAVYAVAATGWGRSVLNRVSPHA